MLRVGGSPTRKGPGYATGLPIKEHVNVHRSFFATLAEIENCQLPLQVPILAIARWVKETETQ